MTTIAMPRRISTLQYVRASIAVRLGWEPEHEGADVVNWAQQLRTMRLADPYRPLSRVDNIPAAEPVRRPIAAIAATPEYSAVDELGPWKPEQHEIAPAHIYRALAGCAR